MKETTKTFIDGMCVGGSFMYLAIAIANLYGWTTVLAGIGVIAFSYCMIIIALAADEERRIRRKQHDAGTHDYYGNKLEDENE
jgi:hypothetical protein